MWPWHVKMTTQTCWGCYCCSCWWWGTCWLRLWSPILVKMFKFTFCWYLVETLKLVLDQDSEDVWSRNYFGKQNSTLGSVVPLARGLLKVPKMDFFIKLIFEVWVFYKYAKLSFFIKRGSFFFIKSAHFHEIHHFFKVKDPWLRLINYKIYHIWIFYKMDPFFYKIY